MTAFSDAELAQEIRSGNQSAFEEISARYQGLIGSIAAKYTAAGFDRADFMQEGLIALLSACKAYDRTKGDASFRNFAAICISRRFMSVIRSANAKGVIPEESLVPYEGIELSDNNALNPETLILRQEDTRVLTQTLKDNLSALEMNVLRLYLSGRTYTHIAQKLGITTKSVDNALQRIRRKIPLS